MTFDRDDALDALHESEERFRAAFGHSSIGMALLRSDRSFIRVNSALAGFLGYSERDLLALGLDEVSHPAERQATADALERLLAGQLDSYETDRRYAHQFGHYVWGSTSVSAVQGRDGSPRYLVCQVQDITKRKHAEEALRVAESKYRTLVEHIPLVTYIDSPNAASSNLYTSPQLEPLLGYSAEEWARDPDLFPKVLHPEDRERVLAEHARSRRTGEPLRTKYRMVAKDGNVLWFQDEAAYVEDEDGQPICLLGYLLDITERIRSEAELRATEEKYRTLIERLPLVTYIDRLDEHSSVVYMSPQIEGVLGYSVEQWTSDPKLFAKLLHPDDRDRVLSEVANTNRTNEPFSSEYRLLARDGRIVWFRDEAVHEFDSNGETVCARGYMLDITAQKHLEEHLRHSQKIEAVGRLAGGVAHDFNNLLTAVMSHAERLLDRLDAEDPRRKNAEEIWNASGRAATLIRQLLTFSREQNVETRLVDLNAVLSGIGNMLGALAGENVEIAYELDRPLGLVRAEPGQIEQIVADLAVNARDAMPYGGALRIETRNVVVSEEPSRAPSSLAPGSYVVLAVTDTGEGIDEETKERLFEPSFNIKDVGKGTGLGLSTVYGIVEQSGGGISVESEVGRGARFEVYFPRGRTDEEVADEASEPGSSSGSEPTTLIAEEHRVREAAIARRLSASVRNGR